LDCYVQIRLTEALEQRSSDQDLEPEQLEKLAKLEDWRRELKQLEDEKSETTVSWTKLSELGWQKCVVLICILLNSMTKKCVVSTMFSWTYVYIFFENNWSDFSFNFFQQVLARPSVNVENFDFWPIFSQYRYFNLYNKVWFILPQFIFLVVII